MARAGKAKKGSSTLKTGFKESKVDSNADKVNSSQELKRNIIDLGGDSDDFELVQDAESDKEVASHPGGKSDKALVKDLKKFVAELGLKDVAPAVVEEVTVEGEEEVSGDSDADNDEGAAEEEDIEGEEETRREVQTKRGLSQPATTSLPSTSWKSGKFIVLPSSHWYSAVDPLPPKASLSKASDEYTASQLAKAKALHEQETERFAKTEGGMTGGGSKSDTKFLSRVLSGGTMSDRLSALTLMAQASPLHNTRALSSLLSISQKKSRDESLKGIRALVDWWVGGGAPDRKLRYFQDQPLTHSGATDAHLVVWYFEDWLKKLFWDILQTLERLSIDGLPYVRTQATAFITNLLAAKPEQEQNLLRLLVNKLGDSEKQLASKASYHLLQLLQQHPNMKSIIVSEVSSLVLRAPLSTSAKLRHQQSSKSNTGKGVDPIDVNAHARYYSTITFNQILLSSSDSDRAVAGKLVAVYFEMFKQLLGVGDSETSKPNPRDDGHGDENGTSERVKGRQEMRKDKVKAADQKEADAKQQPGNTFAEVQDGNERFMSAILTGLHRALPYAAQDTNFFDHHINTLFQLTHSSTFNISIQALLLINSVVSILAGQLKNQQVASSVTVRNVAARYYRSLYASLLDPRLALSSKQALYMNLLLKSLNSDTNTQRVQAVVRRLVAVLVSGGIAGDNAFVCAALYVLGEVASAKKEVRALLRSTVSEEDGGFDPTKREPEFAGAGKSSAWELTPLLNHYHPSVALHSQQLLNGTRVSANADLSLNTLSHFLDRFVYRNPKKPVTRGTSAMQPLVGEGGATGNHRVVRGAGAAVEGGMNEDLFRSRKESNVPADQVFFHKFFTKKREQERGQRKQGAEEDEAVEDDQSDAAEFQNSGGEEDEEEEAQEAEIWKAMKASMRRTGGDEVLLDDSDPDLTEGDEDGGEGESSVDGDLEQPSDLDSHAASGEEPDLEFLEDGDDVLSSDADIPEGFQVGGVMSDEEEDEAWEGVEPVSNKKRKKESGTALTKGGKRRKLKHLPTFASYEDYAKVINDAPEDSI